jgi:hypothetical protein
VIAFWTEVLKNEKKNYTTAERFEATDRLRAYGFGKPPQAMSPGGDNLGLFVDGATSRGF